MNLSDDDLRTLWQERSAESPSDRSHCLTDVEWARLLSTDADTKERVRAASHIAACAACAEEYRLLEPLQSWRTDLERVVPPGDAARAVRDGSGWRAWWPSPRLALAIAAVMVLIVAQAAVLVQLVERRRENARLEIQLAENTKAMSSAQSSLAALKEEQQRLAQFSTPQLDVAIVDLESQYTGVVRGSSEPQIVTRAPAALTVTLILNFPPLSASSTLEVEVADDQGQVRWTGRTQRDRGVASLTLALPSAGYPAGAYVLRLFDVSRGRTSLASYPIVIRSVAEGSR